MDEAYGVVLVDETQEGRMRLRREVSLPGLLVVGEVSSSQEAFTLAQESQADAILINLQEPLVRSLRTVEALASALPNTPIIAVSTEMSRELMRKAVLAGARDVLSRPVRQNELTETLAMVVRRREKRRRGEASSAPLSQGTVITVFGPKGGVGKTTLAINLGTSIVTQSKERVTLVDLDTQVGAASVMLNLVPKRTVTDLLRNLRHIDRDLLKDFVTAHGSGLEVLPSSLWSHEDEDDMTGEEVGQLLTTLSMHYDHVVVDTPPQLSPAVLRALEMSTYIFLVTSLEVASIQATKRVLDKISNWEFAADKVKVVTNGSNSANTLGRGDIETALGCRVFWSIPHDASVATASQLGQPVVEASPSSKAAQSIQQLYYTLMGTKAPSKGLGSFIRGWRR